MAYTDFKLWAPSEEEALLAGYIAADLGFPLAIETGWNLASHRHAFDPIGTVWNDDGTAADGWFANLRVQEDIAAEVEALLGSVSTLGVLEVVATWREWF